MNCETCDTKVERQPVASPPDGSGEVIPNEVNHPSRGWRVTKNTAQNIHLVNPPPMVKVMVPSRRRLIPANTKDRTAAEGASSSKTEMRSSSTGGVGMKFSFLFDPSCCACCLGCWANCFAGLMQPPTM